MQLDRWWTPVHLLFYCLKRREMFIFLIWTQVLKLVRRHYYSNVVIFTSFFFSHPETVEENIYFGCLVTLFRDCIISRIFPYRWATIFNNSWGLEERDRKRDWMSEQRNKKNIKERKKWDESNTTRFLWDYWDFCSKTERAGWMNGRTDPTGIFQLPV